MVGANYVRGQQMDWAPTITSKDKKEVIAYLERAYAGLEKAIKESALDVEGGEWCACNVGSCDASQGAGCAAFEGAGAGCS